MMQLLVFRERIKNLYQRYDLYIIPIVKFLFALIAFETINREIGYDERIKALPVLLALSLLSAFMPSAIMVLLAAFMSVLHVYSESPILAIIVGIIMIILYVLFARFTPKLGYVLLAIPVLYTLKIPFVIPILLGLIATPISIIPTVCGVIIYFVFQVVKTAVTMQVNKTVEDILLLYTNVIDNLTGNKLMILSFVIFAMIILVTYFVRKMKFDYAFEIAIVSGAVTSILGFLISDLILDRSDEIISMILGTIASAAIVYAIHFFRFTLDYSGVEYAQFEDDVYYYYVKAVPKITVTAPQKNVKHFNVKNVDKNISKTNSYNYDDADIDDYDEDEAYLHVNDYENDDE